MDPNPKTCPILSYVLSQLDPNSHPPLPPELREDLVTRLPHLNNPQVLLALSQAIPSNITQTHFLLRSLGPRPDPSAVSIARSKITQIQKDLGEAKLSGIGDDKVAEMENEIEIYRAVVRLQDMHEDYEKQLRVAEDNLIRAYGSVVEELGKVSEDDEVNEEVVGILKEAESGTVERVDLSGRLLKILPEAFGKLHGLLVLNLSHNQLEVIPDSIAGLQRLKELDVSSNLVESLPDSIGLLLNLKVLNLSGNKLNALPESIARCSSLGELDASFNNLTCLPTNIGYGLVNLEKLSVQLNKIRLLPSSICEMRSLKYLDVHFNELRGLPYSIGRLSTLEVLNLSSNFSDLTELPETICDLTNLRELDLSNNQIRVLPDGFFRLDNLTKLNLDENPLIVPPLEIARQGADAVKEFMAKRWLEILEEQQRNLLEANKQQAQTGWLSWGSSLLNNLVSGVSHTVGGYLGGGKTSTNPYLDQQL